MGWFIWPGRARVVAAAAVIERDAFKLVRLPRQEDTALWLLFRTAATLGLRSAVKDPHESGAALP